VLHRDGRSRIDRCLEASIVGSWSRIGVLIRRPLFHWDDEPVVGLDERVIVITGGTSGIGMAAALAGARAGATVVIAGRDRRRADEAREVIAKQAGSGSVISEVVDMGDLHDVEAFSERLMARFGEIHALVHVAGALSRTFETSPDGLELTAAVHVVGPHLLTSTLAPTLVRGAPAVIVWMSSGGMYTQRLDVDRLDDRSPDRYHGVATYALAKRAQVVLAQIWAERLAQDNVACFAMHPGWVDTAALHEGLPRFAAAMRPLLRRPEDGADTAVWLAGGAAGTEVREGIWLDRRLRPAFRWPVTKQDPKEAQRLWDWCQTRSELIQ
jgi:dehydrogenase/reductase SDR family member 12